MAEQHNTLKGNVKVNAQSIASDIARELRAHPERWMTCSTGVSWDPPEKPRCLLGLIEKRGARHDLNVVRAFARFVPKLTYLYDKDSDRTSVHATELMVWNDKVTVDDVIGLCDKVAAAISDAKEETVPWSAVAWRPKEIA